jgi:hypothetical protein
VKRFIFGRVKKDLRSYGLAETMKESIYVIESSRSNPIFSALTSPESAANPSTPSRVKTKRESARQKVDGPMLEKISGWEVPDQDVEVIRRIFERLLESKSPADRLAMEFLTSRLVHDLIG